MGVGKEIRLFVASLVAALVIPAAAWSQVDSGSLTGLITDPSRGLVPGVRITLTDVNKGHAYTAQTDTSGRYLLRSLPSGTYRLSATAAGFKASVREGIVLNAAQNTNLDIGLDVLAGAAFRAAVVKVDITPEGPQWLLGYDARQSKGVHDRIYHRIVAMHDGQTEFVLLSSELAGISPGFYDEFAADLERQTGIRRSQVWWTVTHTHAAPEVGPPGLGLVFQGDRYTHVYDHAYADRVEKSLIDGIKEADAKLAPATLEVGTGMSLANINRRARDPQGHILLGLNPYGSADRQIGLLRLKRRDGSLMALISNYAMHGTVMSGKNLLISGDAPGIVAAYVEEKTGAPMLYINGAAGNIAPIYGRNA